MAADQADSASVPSGLDFTDIVGGTLMLLGILAMTGWATGTRALVSFSTQPDFPTMKVNTAIGFISLGMSLFALRRHYDLLVWLSAITVFLLSLSAVSEHFLGLNPGVNEIFFQDPWSATHPGLMSIGTAISFFLAAVILAAHLPLSRHSPWLYSALLVGFIAIPLISIETYFTNLHDLLKSPLFASYSLPTTIAFLLFIAGIVASTDSGLPALIKQPGQSRMRKTLLGIVTGGMVLAPIAALMVHKGVITFGIATSGTVVALCLLTTYLLAVGSHAQATTVVAALPDELSSHVTAILEDVGDGLLLVDGHRRILWINKTVEQIFGWTQEELLGKPLEFMVPERYQSADVGIYHRFMMSKEGKRRFDARGKALGVTKTGLEKPIAVTIYKRNQAEDPGLAVLQVRELSGIETEMAELSGRRSLDPLTGLPDYSEFQIFCNTFATREARRDEHFLAIMVIDLDNLKPLNERYTREFGDRILHTVATTIKHRLRASDRLFRYGADEFVLISDNRPPADAELMAERMRTSVKVSPTKLHGKNIYITCTIGVYVTDQQRFDLREKVDVLIKQVHATKNGEKDRVLSLIPEEFNL